MSSEMYGIWLTSCFFLAFIIYDADKKASLRIYHIGGTNMEIKIPKEIREYTEAVFFGLSIRQFVFSILAVGIAVLLYFGLQKYVGTETVSWLCILGAAPFAAMGFIRYHGMKAEQFIAAWVKSEFLMPKKLVFKAENMYAITILKGEK
jgi:hypothetical protein